MRLPTSNDHNGFPPKPWVYHTLFWIAYYVFASLITLTIHHIYDPQFYWQLLTLLPPDMALVYIHLFLLREFLVKKHQVVLYILFLLADMVGMALLNIALHRVYVKHGSPFFKPVSDYTPEVIAVQMLNSIYPLALATSFKFGKDWMMQKQQLREIEKTQVATELAFLRSQIHPHFFFNTLNNLYSLTLQKSDAAPEVVLKLSSLMSYMLYESSVPAITLEKELANLENYIALEQLRFGGRLTLCFEKKGQREGIHIPPLLLLAFVENSFKHGMSQIAGEGRIHLRLQVTKTELLFQIDNPILDGTGEEKHGIGLKNVIRRLDLLYGSQYRLDLEQTATTFHVTLKIPLS